MATITVIRIKRILCWIEIKEAGAVCRPLFFVYIVWNPVYIVWDS